MVEHTHVCCFFFFSSRRRHTRCSRDWSSDVCSSDLTLTQRRFTCLTILVFICCVVLAHVQRGTRSQEYLTISADILNYELTTLDNRPQIGRASCRERV